MSEKVHQSSSFEYQIRVDGVPVYWSHILCDEVFSEYSERCKINDGCYVDIVIVNTEILVNQFTYNEMKRHFKNND